MSSKTISHYHPDMDRFLIPPGSIDEQLDFYAIFGNNQPIEVEIGTGKGRFILAESRRRPETNFLGIERSLKWLRVALLRAAKEPRPNLAFLGLDADMVVKLLTPPRSIAAYHVYFPDPWPKERHHKRRLFHQRFLEKMAETLVEQGRLLLRTDHAEYYHAARSKILQSSLFGLQHEHIEDQRDAQNLPETATHYEIKFRQEARKIHHAEFAVTHSNLSGNGNAQKQNPATLDNQT